MQIATKEMGLSWAFYFWSTVVGMYVWKGIRRFANEKVAFDREVEWWVVLRLGYKEDLGDEGWWWFFERHQLSILCMI